MIGLHAPFRRATPEDARAIAEIGNGPGRVTAPSQAKAVIANTVVADDGGVFAVLAGRPAGEGVWHVDVLAVAPERSFDEFGARLLALVDAVAADEGLTRVRLTVDQATDHILQVLDREGFRNDGTEGKLSMSRPVVPQG